MGLMSEYELASLLACPRCRSALEAVGDGYRCTCGFAGRRLGRWPVLVDFDSSIIDEARLEARGGQSTLRRAGDTCLGRLRRHVRSWLQLRGDHIERIVALLPPGATVVVVGGGADQHGLDRLYNDPDLAVVGFDIYGSDLVQFIADGHAIPLLDGSVDAVIAQAVLEHVLDPPRVVAEIHRILGPAGIVYAETAFLQQVHEGAYDFTRYTESGHRWLFRQFELIDAGPLTGPMTQVVWTADHLVRCLTRSVRAGQFVHRVLAPLGGLDRFVPFRFAVDDAPAVAFLGRRSEVALAPRDMVAYYRGAQA